jgi:hypothetical protein
MGLIRQAYHVPEYQGVVNSPTKINSIIPESALTAVGNEQYVASIIREEIKRLTDLDAKLGMEYW